MGKMQEYERKALARLRKYAPECTVLLKNKGDFPLKGPGQLALYGNGARRTVKGGTGSGDVNSRFYSTAEKGLEKAGFTITTKKWLDGYDEVWQKAHKEFVADIKRQAKATHTLAVMLGMGAVMSEPAYELPLEGEGDTAVYVLGRISGEGSDRRAKAGDFCLTETEIRDILAANEKYEHFMLVLNVGGVVDLTPVNQVDNILILSQLGSVTGLALADILLGRQSPSGRLTDTWSAWEDYSVIGDFGEPDDVRYREGIYVGYRYFDSAGKRPLYPFGYGLSYTSFSHGAAKVSLQGTRVMLSVPVKNEGAYAGKEVVQVYVSVPWGRLDQPPQTLAGFAKTRLLKPGEAETVRICFGLEELASYDAGCAAWVLEAGRYLIRAGRDSRNTRLCAVAELGETVTLRQVSHVGGTIDFTDWQPEKPVREEAAPEAVVLTVDPAAFAGLKWEEPACPSDEARDFVEKLSDEQLAFLCVGSYKEGAGVASIIGNGSQSVAGAAGESCGRIPGVAPLIMADGPAGLRLSRHYTKQKDGVVSVGGTMPAGFGEFFSPAQTFFMKLLTKRPKGEIYDQFCTAIPIGTGLAQSWNLELCESCGEIVGKEMERFGVHLWLAPACNIHRNPLCGRNFEYYSEDPLISGRVAAAVTRGVQALPGRGTTVKHFCCNNQEYNRMVSNSMVSERALREIYLRGFRICMKEARPAAIMTSYNLLNGVHTSERTDLLKTLVREEWGYRGLIMTDWVISAMGGKGKYRIAKAAPTVQAGNDVFMPGSGADYKQLLDALRGKNREFTLTRKEAEWCAAFVTDAAWRLAGKQ